VPELALVDMATMEAVRERIERNKVLSRRNQKHEYLMTGILRCACCGNVMTGLTRLMNGYEVIYYQCGIRGKRGETGDLICANSSKTISTRKVDAIVWGWLEGLLSDEDKLRKGVRAMAELSQSKVAPRLQRLEAIRDLIEKAERKMKRLVSEIADTEDEFILAALRQELKTASRHKESLQIEKGELERALAQETVTPETEQRIIDMAGAIRERMTDAPFELKRVLLDFLNVRVFFYHDKTGRGLKMECDLPFSLQTMPISPIDLGLSRRRSRW
jgi:site-specific DNA recombinase